jgi:class 3 adenylate cyclase
MVAVYTGTQQRATYTCVGDTVNLAARLEAHTKLAGRPLLIDGATQAGLPAGCSSDALGALEIRGRSDRVEVYAPRL